MSILLLTTLPTIWGLFIWPIYCCLGMGYYCFTHITSITTLPLWLVHVQPLGWLSIDLRSVRSPNSLNSSALSSFRNTKPLGNQAGEGGTLGSFFPQSFMEIIGWKLPWTWNCGWRVSGATGAEPTHWWNEAKWVDHKWAYKWQTRAAPPRAGVGVRTRPHPSACRSKFAPKQCSKPWN